MRPLRPDLTPAAASTRAAMFVAAFAAVAAVFAAALASPLAAQQPERSFTADQQIRAAVMPLPEELREGAAVLGRAPGTDGLSELRPGTNEMICLAPDPEAERFHVACYHASLEPFMARGRELREMGVSEVDTVRYAEVVEGTLPVPDQAAALYSLTGDWTGFDAEAGSAEGATPLFVVYMPFATVESTGVSAVPKRGEPWLMFPGTPKAHLMFIPEM